MKILFLVPPELLSIESYTSNKISKVREIRPKLGFLYIVAYLHQEVGITPIILDCLTKGTDL